MKNVAWTATDAVEDAVLRQIEETSKSDPFIGAKVGSNELTQRLLAIMKGQHGVHLESLLCALGAIAGYACQASIRAQAVARGLAETALLTSLQTADGKTYYFGDHLNEPLTESPYSVWAVAGGVVQEAGCDNLPDLADVFKHTASTVGTAAFGKPRVAEWNSADELPIDYVRTLWPALKPLIVRFCPNPQHWPVLVGLSIQEAIIMGEPALDPGLALQLVMEAAIPMSKIDLNASIA